MEDGWSVPGKRTRHALQYLSIRLLLRAALPRLLGPPALASGAEHPAAGRRLLFLRLLEPEVPRPADPLDGHGLRVRPVGRPCRGPAAAQGHRRPEHGLEPGDARHLQVLQLLRRELA